MKDSLAVALLIIVLVALFSVFAPSYSRAQFRILTVPQGGTGSSTLSGILRGDGTNSIQSLIIGSGLTYSAGTLSATGGSGGTGNVATSSSETSGRIPFWTSTAATPATLSGGSANLTWDDSANLFKVTGNASTTQFTTTGAAFIATDGANVGIGTANPVSELHLHDPLGTTASWYFTTTATGATASDGLRIRSSNSTAAISNLENSTLSFGTNGNDRITIAAAGNVGVATTTPFGRLSIEAIAGDYPFAIGSSTNPVLTVLPSGGVSVGTITETIASSGFLATRGDLYTSGSLASEGRLYTDTALNINGSDVFDVSRNLVNLNGTVRAGSGNGLSFQTNGASTARLFITTTGNVGVATSTPSSLFQVFSTATSTASFDSNSTNQGGCLEIKDQSGTGYTYITAEDGVLSASTVSCK